MKLRFLILPLMVLFLSSHSLLMADAPKKILWVPMEGTVELGLSPYIKRALDYAEEKKFDAMVLEVDTFGGRVDAAVVIRDRLLDSPVMTVAWVNKRAISAGALISIACKKIYFSPGSTMGAATPVQMDAGETKPVGEKVVSYFRAEMGATAEKNKRDRKIAEGMVNATEAIPGLVAKNGVLTLTDQTALKVKYSDGTVSTQKELQKALSLEGAEIETFSINWAEKIVRFLTDPTVSGLLISGGLLGIFFELQAPGFGFAGILGVTCLALFFFGKFLVHLAGWEEVLLMMLGFILLAVEFLFLPGYLIPGILGAILIIWALVMAGVSSATPFSLDVPSVQEHINSLGIALIAVLLGLIGIYIFVMKNPRRSPLVLSDELSQGQGYRSSDDYGFLLTKEGTAQTDLRPAGKVEIENQVYQVVTDGEFVERNARVKVTTIEGTRIVVHRL